MASELIPPVVAAAAAALPTALTWWQAILLAVVTALGGGAVGRLSGTIGEVKEDRRAERSADVDERSANQTIKRLTAEIVRLNEDLLKMRAQLHASEDRCIAETTEKLIAWRRLAVSGRRFDITDTMGQVGVDRDDYSLKTFGRSEGA